MSGAGPACSLCSPRLSAWKRRAASAASSAATRCLSRARASSPLPPGTLVAWKRGMHACMLGRGRDMGRGRLYCLRFVAHMSLTPSRHWNARMQCLARALACKKSTHGILHACLSTIRAPAHVSVMRCFIHTRTPSHPSITPPSCAAHCMHACGPAGAQPHRCRTVTAKSTGARPQPDTAGCCASTQVQFKLFATRILEERGAQAQNRPCCRCGRRQRAPTWSVSAPRRPPQATGLVRPEASRSATGQGQRAGGQARTAAARPAWVGCAAGQCAGGQACTAAARPA